jgi:hypothetical protein
MSNETKPSLTLDDLVQAAITDDGGGLNTVRLRIRGTSVAVVWHDDDDDSEFSTAEALRVARAIKALPALIAAARDAHSEMTRMAYEINDRELLHPEARAEIGQSVLALAAALAALEPETDHTQNDQ